MFDNIFLGITGVGTFFSGCYLFGRWSVNKKIVDLEELKTALIESQKNHDDLIDEINQKIEDVTMTMSVQSLNDISDKRCDRLGLKS